MKFIDLKCQIVAPKHTLTSNRNEQLLAQYCFEPSELASRYLFYIQLYEEMSVTFPWSIEHHELDSYLFLYCNHGHAQITLNNQVYELNEHNCLFLDCNTPFLLEITHCTWSYEALYINGNGMKKFYDMFLSDGIPICLDDSNKQLKSLLRKLNIKKEKSNNIRELLQSQTITELLTCAVILKMQKAQKTVEVPEYIVKMKTILDQRYTENHTLDSIASEINYNKFKLAKDFKLYTTYSPIDYLIRIRIDAAKELLEETRLSVSEVGYQVGIENTPHFINLFKKITGTTPNRYRLHTNCNIV